MRLQPPEQDDLTVDERFCEYGISYNRYGLYRNAFDHRLRRVTALDMSGLDTDLLDRFLSRWSQDTRKIDATVPLLRTYIRYWPVRRGKPFVWSRVVEPYFAWRPRAFRARTAFGFDLEGNSKDLIQQWVYYLGVWEPALTAWIRRRLQRGDTFIDVGANVGYYALLASQSVGPSGRIVAIEASPAICASLRRNAALNRADNVRIVNVAAFGCRSTVRLYRGNDANCGETTIVNEFGGDLECEVDAFPLHELLTPAELESARLIKIDAEGAEYTILAGLDSFRRLRPDVELIVEVHPDYLAKRGESLDELLALMHREAFIPYVVQEEYWVPAYLERKPVFEPPRRLSAPVKDGTALVFSRIDADVLP